VYGCCCGHPTSMRWAADSALRPLRSRLRPGPSAPRSVVREHLKGWLGCAPELGGSQRRVSDRAVSMSSGFLEETSGSVQ
jgi:hypothetical protein